MCPECTRKVKLDPVKGICADCIEINEDLAKMLDEAPLMCSRCPNLTENGRTLCTKCADELAQINIAGVTTFTDDWPNKR